MTSPIAHAALVDEAGIVRQVIVIPHVGDDDAAVTDYCNSIGLPGRWMDCSYLGARRGKFAGIGDYYDHTTDQFLPSPPPVDPDEESQ